MQVHNNCSLVAIIDWSRSNSSVLKHVAFIQAHDFWRGICSLTALEHLSISNCKIQYNGVFDRYIEGEMPSGIGKLVNLRWALFVFPNTSKTVRKHVFHLLEYSTQLKA